MSDRIRPDRQWVERYWSGSLAAGLFLLTVLTRLPGLVSARMFDVDESYLAAMGLTMGRGGKLYIDALDRKPPLLPWLYSLSERMLGTVDLRLLRWVLVLGVAAAGFVVARIVLRIGGNRRGAAAAGVLLVLGTVAFLPADGQAANFELFALFPACAAVWVALVGQDRRLSQRLLCLAAAGALVGVAGMVKQPLFAMVAPIGCVVWQHRPRVVGALAVASGLVSAVVATGLPFGLSRVWEWAWVQTSDFLDGQVGGWRIIEVLLLVVAVFAAFHLPALAASWRRRAQFREVDPVVWWWLIGAVLAIVPGFRFIFHYFQLLVPPIAVLAGWVLSKESRRTVRNTMVGASVIAMVCTLLAVLPAFDAGRVRPDLITAIQQRTGHDDRILVWGAMPEVYWRAERLPAARFLSVGYLTGKWADRTNPPNDPEHTRPWRWRWPIFESDLRAHPPALIVDMTGSGLDGWAHYRPDHYSFGTILRECYQREPDLDHLQIWQLRDESCVRRDAVAAAG